MIQVFAVKQEEEEEDESGGSELLSDWELVSLENDEMELKLVFKDALGISQGDIPDLLLIQLELSEFKDDNNNQLPDSLIKYAEIPRQMATELEVERVATLKESVGNASKASIVSNFLIGLVLAGSLSLVWGVINGL